MDQELLRSVPIFAELTDQDLEVLARLATRRRYPKDGVVFFENEEGSSFFMIVHGRIKVTILGDDGREIILSILGPGDFFGEMALLDNEPRSATAIAVEESELLLVTKTTRERFAALCSAIREVHGYDVPEIVGLPASDVEGAYAAWVRGSV